MLASQATHRENEASAGDEDSIISDKQLTNDEKRIMLQKFLHMAASNGDIDRVNKALEGEARTFIDINAADEEGRTPIVYASCFVGYAPSPESRRPC